MIYIPPSSYPPLASKALIFLKAAAILRKPKNRVTGLWEASYYLLSHSLELAIKAVVQEATGEQVERIHNIDVLADKYKEVCLLTEADMQTINQFSLLNSGPGGLRYDNLPLTNFLPSTFKKGEEIIEKLLNKLRIDVESKNNL